MEAEASLSTALAAPAAPAQAAAPAAPAQSASPGHAPRRPRNPNPRLDHRAQATAAERGDEALRKVHVMGYPEYTQQQDLARVFSKFGAVKVEKNNNKFATVWFSTKEEAKRAIQDSRKVNIYGEFLTVKPFNGKLPAGKQRQPHTPKRDFTRSKQKGVIIKPEEIDLSGDFHQQVDNILATVRLTQEEVKSLSALYYDLETVLQSQWPGCKAVPFGSITTGLGIKTSDADCFINVPPQYRHPNGNFVNKAKRVLQQYPQGFAEILSIPSANTPIVKFFHIPTETNCDVSFKTPLGAQNSKLIAFLLHTDPRLIPVAVLIKYWAKVHGLSGTGRLTNYALTMLIIFYLQQPPLSILPAVEWLQRDPADEMVVDYWNTGFLSHHDRLPPPGRLPSISELLGGFFEFYSVFNFDEIIVCPYLGAPIAKDAFKDPNQLPAQFARYRHNVMQRITTPLRFTTAICVQDPFEQCHNVASAITSRLASEMKAYFKFAASAYEKEKQNNCREFLKTILLQKPKIVRDKSNPEYRVNLFPRIVVNIVSADWKSVVRDIVFVIFEKMLKLKLGKMEEKMNPDSRKEKEKYTGTVTRAIWKRKQFAKLYSVMKLDLLEKEARITDEVLNVDKQNISLQFQLTVTYCHEPRSAVVAIKMSDGELDMFREFGKFFISVTQHWFVQLLKPHTRPAERNTAERIEEAIRRVDEELEADLATDSDDEMLNVSVTQTAGGQRVDVSVGPDTANANKAPETRDSDDSKVKHSDNAS